MPTQTPNPNLQTGAVLIVALLFLLLMTIIGVSGISSSFMEEKMVGNSINRERAFQAAEAALRGAERDLASGTRKDIIYAAICASSSNATDSCDRAYDASGTKVKASDDDLGDDCPDGYCTPREQDFDYDRTAQNDCSDANYIPERWVSCPLGSAAAGNNLDLFTTANKYQEYATNGTLGVLSQDPRYIIEFLGYRIPDGELSACDTDSDGYNDNPPESAYWPFCVNDTAYFRVTAMGYGRGNATTRVMLQTTVLVD